MATRTTTHILKNSDIINRPLPSSLFKGEAIVNTAEGIVFFSGVTTSTSGWTHSSPSTPTFWEVGSNLYDLKIRNQIASYAGLTNLSGKFLSGTTSGFVLNDISAILGVDTYVTGFTYSNNVATIKQNYGQADLSVLINTMTGLTVSGSLSAITFVGNGALISGLPYVTGGTYSAGNTIFTNSTGGTFTVTGYTTTDTYVTGFTYNPSQNLLTIKQNQGQLDLIAQINSVSGLSVSNLIAGRVVFVGNSGLLTDDAGFTYDTTTNTLSVPSDGTVNVGTGGLNVAGDTVIQGSLTVFGPAISAFTSQLYVEDNNVILNYNPTGSTAPSSIGAGWTIQDGNGIALGDVNFDIRRMDSLTGLTASQVPDVTEYTGSTGYSNRGWVTQLNDIVIRSTNVSTPNGVRVLTEFDVLDGGIY